MMDWEKAIDWKKTVEHGTRISYDSSMKKLEHLEHQKAIHESRFHSKFTVEQIEHLAVMARENILPDGTYGDDECAVWVILRRVFNYD